MITLDRIEGDIAVLIVNGLPWDFPADALPQGIQEGDRLVWAVDTTSTAQAKADAEARVRRLAAASNLDDNIKL